ncbi:MAG TPA: hypothetical protein VJB08_04725 [Candidatus Nanoarchaeia archaeon]|nr:hypothetical protein [Candidatus Nanoarchaeia archaeon]
MTDDSVYRLVKAGFIKSKYKPLYAGLDASARARLAKSFPGKEVEEHADVDIIEIAKDQMISTEYPASKRKWRLIFESTRNIEETYFWILDYARDMGFSEFIKTTDSFTASEHSSFFGTAQQRLGLQQDRVSQYLATIGKMVKELFQLVRELRILDERLAYYSDSYDYLSRSRESAEITLKGTFIDQVEGGAKNPASVYGMSRELQFTVLPDLFFTVHPKTSRDVDEAVDRLEFNRKVKEVLKRKLRSYMEWKEHTFDELKNRRRFTLKYLKQHYDVIKMYMTWVRPYLRNIRRLQSEAMDIKKASSVDSISAFEGSLIDIEFMALALPQGNKDVYAVSLITFEYRTIPAMSFQQEGFQRGPLHSGEIKMNFRCYAWTREQINSYKQMKEEEDMALLGVIDGSVRAAMEALGTELETYLKEAGEETFQKGAVNAPVREPGVAEPFIGILKGFKELFGVKSAPGKKPKVDAFKREKETDNAFKTVKSLTWAIYKNYKKAHKMVSW